jgi:acetyl-CoA carboxylase carboxyl transferase subunit alpha
MISGGYYGVISPEGAASILGRYKDEADKAIHFPKDCHSLAIAQRIYANQLKDIGIVDEIIWEKYDGEQGSESFNAFPILGARIRDFIARSLQQLLSLNEDGLVANRYEKFRGMGVYEILSEEERIARVHSAVEKVGNKSKKEIAKTATAVASKIIQFISQTSMNGEFSR